MSTDPLDSIILPSQIFGVSRGVQANPEEMDEKAREAVRFIEHMNIHDQLFGTTGVDKERLKINILEASGANIKVAHRALKILQKSAKTPVEEQILKDIDQEICSMLHKPVMDTLDFVSPRKVSLQEGDLPDIPKRHREVIGGYLRGSIL